MPIYKFYRNLLSQEEQKLYDILLLGFDCCENSIRLPKVDERTVQRVFEAVLYDNPHIFYVEGLNTQYTILSANTVVYPVYRFNAETISNHKCAYRSVVNRIVAYSKTFDDYEKVKLIHDLFCRKIRYDIHHPNAHTIVGALIDKVAVCEGIAKAAKLLFDDMGINSCVVFGSAKQDNLLVENHAWNKVNINGFWYNLDITFDVECSKCGCIRYDYFNFSDSDFLEEHKQSDYNYPICNSNKASFYSKNNLCIYSERYFKELLHKTIIARKTQLTVKFGNIADHITLNNIQAVVENTLYNCMNECKYEIYYNQSTMVCSIIMKDY